MSARAPPAAAAVCRAAAAACSALAARCPPRRRATAPPRLRRAPQPAAAPRAVRKQAPAAEPSPEELAAAAEWIAFAEADVPDERDAIPDTISPEFAAAVNLMCNRTLKARRRRAARGRHNALRLR